MEHHFDYVWGMVRDLRATSSTIDKQGIIEDYCNINNTGASFTKKILLYTYHPLWQYNVTSDNLKKKNQLKAKNSYKNFFDLLDDLKGRAKIGRAYV